MEITVLAPRNFRVLSIWMFPKIVVPNNHRVFLLKMIILGWFGDTTISGNTHIPPWKLTFWTQQWGGEREDWSSFSTQVIFRFQPLVFRGLYVGSFAELGTSRLLNLIFCWRVFFFHWSLKSGICVNLKDALFFGPGFWCKQSTNINEVMLNVIIGMVIGRDFIGRQDCLKHFLHWNDTRYSNDDSIPCATPYW